MRFSSWDILSHHSKILITLQQKVINGFCKLYFEAQTGYHPKEQKYSWYFVSRANKNPIYFEISQYVLQF